MRHIYAIYISAVLQEYNFALRLCYGRYLVTRFGDSKPEMVADIAILKQIYFASGFSSQEAHLTVRC